MTLRASACSMLVALLVLGFAAGCAVVPGGVGSSARRISLAKSILDSPRISLLSSHVSGKRDDATALLNLQQTARGRKARRSYYGRAPGGYVGLDPRMLRAMHTLAREGYSFRVTEVAGGSHSGKSRHYLGVAFDVDMVNGQKVRYRSAAHYRFMRRCKELGATEVKGPGDRGHSSHIHAAWPRTDGR